jgi:hypothetical protein
MMLCRLLGMSAGLGMMTMRDVSVVSGFFVIPRFVMLSRFFVMCSCMLVVFRRFFVMLCTFVLGHWVAPSRLIELSGLSNGRANPLIVRKSQR